MTYFFGSNQRGLYRRMRLVTSVWLVLSLLLIPSAGAVFALPQAPIDTPQVGPVVTVNDASDEGDGVCGVISCTLREAITAANANGTINDISFTLTDTLEIMPTSPLPTITAPVTIDGRTQAGATCFAPTVELNGSMAGAGANGLNITANATSIIGLRITHWSANGIRLANNTTNTIECNWIGVSGNGTMEAGNAIAGIRIENSGSNTIGNSEAPNVISANGIQGIVVTGVGSTNNTIQQNIIGLGADSTTALGNIDGIYVFNVGNNSILSNTISKNLNSGIVIGGASATNNIIKNNYIGTNFANKPLGNYSNGIVLDGAIGTIVGGSISNDSNVIGDNGNYGINIFTSTASGNQIKGNYIGVARNGTTSIPNFFHGIRAVAGSGTIGGTAAGEGNMIAFNKVNGIMISKTISTTASNYTIVGNSIFANIKLGIDLDNTGTISGDGVTANDNLDADVGPNTLQNYPILSLATSNGSQVQITGALTSTANSTFNLDFYSSNDCDSSTYGEGRVYLGRQSVNTNASGVASFTPITFNTPVAQGQKITATATNAAGSTSEFSNCVTIGNLPNVSINNVTVLEGNSGVTSMNFTVSLSGAASAPVVVQYTTSDNSAFAGLDYVAKTGSVTIPTGQLSAQISITINGDTVYEPNDETFLVNLLSATNASIEKGEGTGTIDDDDTAPTITISNSSLIEGDVGTSTMVFTVTLSNASNQPINVDFATANGTATAPSDYLPISGTLTFEHDTITQTIEVQIVGDVIDEPNETFFVNLSNSGSTVISDAQGQGTIIDDEATPTVSISDVTVTEPNTGNTVNAVFTVTLSGASQNSITVNYATANGTATAPADYATASGTVTFAPGQTSKTISVTINGDNTDEADETFVVNLTAPTNATLGDAQGTGTITDNDAAPTLSIADSSVAEGNAGTKTMVFTVTLSAASALPVTVSYTTTNGTATAPADFIAANGTLTFAAGETSKTISITIKGDNITEGNETFNVVLSNPVNATINDGTGVGTIIDAGTKILVYLPLIMKNS